MHLEIIVLLNLYSQSSSYNYIKKTAGFDQSTINVIDIALIIDGNCNNLWYKTRARIIDIDNY